MVSLLATLIEHRRAIWRNALGEMRHRYAGAGLGGVWHVIVPLAQIVVFTLVFSHLIRVRDLNGPGGFALYLCSGLLPWLAFVETVTRGTQSFVGRASYLKKLPTHEIVYLAQDTLEAFLGLLISMALLVGVTLVLGGAVHATWLLVPPVLVLLMAFGFGLGLLFGTINVFLRDAAQLVGVVLLAWMWLTPIVYSVDDVPSLRQILVFNPVYWHVDAMHRLYLYGELPTAPSWLVMIGVAVASLGFAMLVFSKLRPQIRDVL